MKKLTFLTTEQIFGDGDKSQLEIFKKYGTRCAVTDFAILLGGKISENFTSDGKSLDNRAGNWWSSSNDKEKNKVKVIGYDDKESVCSPRDREKLARPAMTFPVSSAVYIGEAKGKTGIMEIEYGSYPQTSVGTNSAKKLEEMYTNGKLRATGKKYTTDTIENQDYHTLISLGPKDFEEQTHIEYEYNRKKYVRVVAHPINYPSFASIDGPILSNGNQIRNGSIVWVEVEPITWLVDKETKIGVAKKALFAGVQFDVATAYNGNFEETWMNKFLNDYFAKEISTGKDYDENEIKVTETTIKDNPYNFNFTDVSEEDIIKGALKSDIAVFLHGQSSEGKSARVKQLDPNCEVIYLRNATPESLNGKSVYNAQNGEMIDIQPPWLKKIIERCKNEPDKIHIVFFDEITNAPPSLQGMAFNIALEREVNGIWKLPDNCRIVAAGNDTGDSLAANTLAEPLFNRFAHVYIKTTVSDWLKWASTADNEGEKIDYESARPEHKIHPAIYAFIAYKGEESLRSKYTGEKPNADPRKWEMASKLLYKTNNPKMLRSLVGEDITVDFCNFCNQQVVTLKDVINGNYRNSVFEMNTSEKYATTVGLSYVNYENLNKVRNFVSKLGKEFVAVFDSLWSYGNEMRMEKIAELRSSMQSTEGGRRL